ncbi:MAG: 50S ribosomal protein L11 methyltransferase [Acidimicrobiales bacterium]
MAEPSVYSLHQFGEMILDEVRMAAHLGALQAAISPGDVVIDIGTGPGTIAMLCVRLGAGHVYALDPDPAVRLARQAVRRNGMEDRITVIEGVSQDFSPPNPVDVIVSDLRDRLPLNGSHIRTIVDARSRLLRPGGAQIPRRDTLYAAPVSHPAAYDDLVAPWATERFDLDMRDVRTKVLNRHDAYRAEPEHLVAAPAAWGSIDYATVVDPDLRGECGWMIERDATVHGLEVWFDADLGFGFGYSNAPGAPDLVYGTEFFPFAEPLDARAGDRVEVRLEARHVKDTYLWRWSTTHRREDEVRVSFTQSDLQGSLDDPRTTLWRQRPEHVPSLSPEALATHVVLEAFRRGESVAAATRSLDDAAVDGYAGDQAAAFVAALSARYSDAEPDGSPP